MTNDSEAPDRSTERYRVVVERDVQIPMRDGTLLAMDVHLPDAAGPFPVLLERTPYDKSASVEVRMDSPNYFASRGYAVAIQDVRGCFVSEGENDLLVNDGWGERRDGYDTLEALARFPWCNGRVGTIGGSYSGWTQYFLAPTRPPHLTTQFVREASGDVYGQGFLRGGALELSANVHGTLYEALRRLVRLGLDPDREALHSRISADLERLDETCRRRPLVPILPPDVPELSSPGDEEAWRHPSRDTYWQPLDALAHADQIDVPIAHLGGWFDYFIEGTTAMFEAIRHRGGVGARGNQRLVVGPWLHGPEFIDQRRVGDLDFGPDAVGDYNAMRLPWLDRWLRDVSMEDDPIVRFFTMGANHWQDATDWPPDTRESILYLGPGPSRSTLSLNNGDLLLSPPVEEGLDAYRHDPDDPITTMGGNWFADPNGPRDHRAVEPRLLTYTSPILAADLEITGQPIAELCVSSSALDTDFVVRICDVYPDGRAMLVDEGILRARFRDSFAEPTLLTPGRIERFRIPLSPTSIVVPAGHRLRLHVASSSFPRWHPNTGNAESSWLAPVAYHADNAVYRARGHPSCLRLPIRSPLHFAGDRA